MRRKARKEFFNRKLFLFVQASENVNLFYVLVGATIIILAIAFLAFGYDTCANAYDFRSVMAHAFGEALGLVIQLRAVGFAAKKERHALAASVCSGGGGAAPS